MLKTVFTQLEPLPRTLGMAEFATPLHLDSVQRIADNRTRGIVHARGYLRLQKNPEPDQMVPAFVVRVSLSKTQVTIARCYYQGEHHARRLADLVKLFFWKYRARNLSAHIQEFEFNFPPAQAQADLENEKEIVAALKIVESRLVTLRILPTEQEREAYVSTQRERAHRGRPSANAEIKKFAEQLTRIEACLNDIKKGLFKSNE